MKNCKYCGYIAVQTTIPYPKTIILSKTTLTYNGKAQKPAIVVKDINGKTIASSNYTVTYPSGCKNVGSYTVKVTFKGNYSGSKSLTYRILPKGTKLKTLKAGSKQLTVKWTKQATQTTGYELQYALNKKFASAKTITVKAATVSKVIKGLKAKKKYFARIRTYKTVGKKKYYSSWSAVKTATVKK